MKKRNSRKYTFEVTNRIAILGINIELKVLKTASKPDT